jgi:hypothetical protein
VRHRRIVFGLGLVAATGCTAVLGIDEDYFLDSGHTGGAATSQAQAQTVASGAAGSAGLPDGAPCSDSASCASGHCVDGVCCAEACDGPCLTCADDGACGPVEVLTDPGMDCAPDQTCDGEGACFACNLRPDPPGQGPCPVECTGGCSAENECLIACTSTTCMAEALACPADYACRVTCDGSDGCRDATVTCPASYACRVECNGMRACDGVEVVCTTGVCELACDSGAQVCSSATLQCGSEACLASCGSNSTPAVRCGSACYCQTC